jgi:hypothetical protein
MEFDLVTNRYLYTDRYIKMKPYFLIIRVIMFGHLEAVMKRWASKNKNFLLIFTV